MNYFNYFTEIEEHFQRKRGAQIWLSPVDWALIASWQEAGIPLQAVLAGIDQAFEKFESGRRRDRRPRALAYCAAAVLDAAAAAQAAAEGGHAASPASAPPPADAGFSRERIALHLRAALAKLETQPALAEIPPPLRALLAAVEDPSAPVRLEEWDRTLSVLDERIFLLLQQITPVERMVEIRAALDRDLLPHRRGLRAEQIMMIERRLLQKMLLEAAALPRLSLFYMLSG